MWNFKPASNSSPGMIFIHMAVVSTLLCIDFKDNPAVMKTLQYNGSKVMMYRFQSNGKEVHTKHIGYIGLLHANTNRKVLARHIMAKLKELDLPDGIDLFSKTLTSIKDPTKKIPK